MILILTFVVIGVICVVTTSNWGIPYYRYATIAATGEVNYSAVCNINFTTVSQILVNKSFSIKNQSGGLVISYFIENLEPWAYGMSISISADTTLQKARIDIWDTATILESEINEEKNYIINRTNTVSSVCNFTIDWNKVTWSVSYQD